MFESRGETTPPCGTPDFGRRGPPPSRMSITGAARNLRISASIELSTTRVAITFIRRSCGIESKYCDDVRIDHPTHPVRDALVDGL